MNKRFNINTILTTKEKVRRFRREMSEANRVDQVDCIQKKEQIKKNLITVINIIRGFINEEDKEK